MLSGKILSFFALLLYVFVTLTPDIYWQNLVLTPHMSAYPFVIFWQGGLVLMIVLFLLRLYPQGRPFYLLGHGLDRWVLFVIAILFLNCLFAQFKPQAVWQGGIALAFITSAYALWQHLKISQNPLGLLRFQALLQTIYMGESLTLWLTQKLLPQWQHIQALKREGVQSFFHPFTANLHNTLPAGDSNYVAGYVVLALPLLFTLALAEKGFWQKVGILGFVLGLLTLFSTSSYVGLVGLAVILCAFLFYLGKRSRLTVGAILGAAIFLLGFIIANSYLREFVFALPQGKHEELFYRSITNTVGWEMGKSHWLLGAGLGAVPLLYQKFRPQWGLDRLEMDVQLHSTPLQIWAELGIVGVLATLWWLFLLARSQSNGANLRREGITIALVGYLAVAILDYQLDVLAISGTLLIYLTVWLYWREEKEHIFVPRWRRLVSLGGWGLLLAGIAWVTPIDWAWYLSSQGFSYLREYQRTGAILAFERFQTQLQRALELVPWESYYATQLGWNLGLKAWDERDQNLATKEQKLAIDYFRQAIKANPYQEFNYQQLAWLLYKQGDMSGAKTAFQAAINLLPYRPSLHFGLGLSLLRQGNDQEGIKEIAQECFYHPLFVTSPLWRTQQLQGIYESVTNVLAPLYQQQKRDRNLAVLYWWLGKPNALQSLQALQQPITTLLVNAVTDRRDQLQTVIERPHTATETLISAWYNPQKRLELIRRAWLQATEDIYSDRAELVMQSLLNRMNTSTNFDAFLRSPLPLFTPLNWKEPNLRTGFGVISRHVDGPDPFDLFVVEKNAIFAHFWSELFR
ncbi:MAG: O-antigen ligase family protein [Pseudanabaenaceae cyanobacterium]